jgi:hypothetical protein
VIEYLVLARSLAVPNYVPSIASTDHPESPAGSLVGGQLPLVSDHLDLPATSGNITPISVNRRENVAET